MKAVLVIEMPDCCNNCPCYDGMEDRSSCNVLNEDMRFASYGRLGNCPLKPLPQKKHLDESLDSENFKLEYSRFDGWNACLDAIAGDTDKENLNDTADIIRKWGRYCACGEKMMPNTAGGWYCPVCHRTMKSILFKRVK